MSEIITSEVQATVLKTGSASHATVDVTGSASHATVLEIVSAAVA